MSTTRKGPRYGLATDPGLPPLAEATSIALAVLRAAKVIGWRDLLTEDGTELVLPYEIILTDRQMDLLVEHQHLLMLVRRSTPAVKGPDDVVVEPGIGMATYAVCPACDRWMLMSSGSVPARCLMTVHCPGSPVKAAAASKEVPSEASLLDSVGSEAEPGIEPAEPAESQPVIAGDQLVGAGVSAAGGAAAYNPDDYSDFD